MAAWSRRWHNAERIKRRGRVARPPAGITSLEPLAQHNTRPTFRDIEQPRYPPGGEIGDAGGALRCLLTGGPQERGLIHAIVRTAATVLRREFVEDMS